uniref:Si:dkeyp-104b3.18 n=1 Tax=Cyprinus carpio TaxID=7962 RepID=A0A8C1TXI8_CYPCA
MTAYAKTNTFYISIWFWLILGVECYDGWSSHVLTVNTGGSVTIPCYYDKKYTQQKKYWFSEIDKSNTYTNTTEQNLSVIDHPDQSLFTVTMRNLQNKHTGNYYCVVETGEQPPIKTIYEPQLKIQSGKTFCKCFNQILMFNSLNFKLCLLFLKYFIISNDWCVCVRVCVCVCVCVCSAPDVSVVNSSVSGHEGGDISVQCFYSSGYKNKSKQWCRYKDQSCYTVGRTVTSQISSVQISDDDGRRSCTVLMTGLRLTDSGWYYCSVGDALSSVHITVVEAKPGTVSDKENQTAILKNHNNETKETEKPPNNELLIVWLLPALAALLLLSILVGVFTWRLRRRPKQDKHHIRGRNGSRTTDMIYSKPEDPVILYSTINDEIPHDPNNDITYSIIDDVPRSEVMKSPAGGAIYSIIYSTVGPH